MTHYPSVRFSDLFQRVERKVILEDTETYQRIGVRWYGLGAFIRDSELGINISRKQQWIVEAGDVIYNKLFAWKGSFAVAGTGVHGHIASDKFPTYRHDQERLDIDYLRYYFQTPSIAKQAERLSKGAAAISKLTLNPPQFWDLTIPLPPLAEQQRVVARIEALAGKIEAARRLRREAAEEAGKVVTNFARHELNSLPQQVSPLSAWLGDPKIGIQTGPFGTQLSSADFTENGVPVLTIGNIQETGLRLDGLKRVPTDKAEALARFALHEGDILFARMGTVGRSCVVPSFAAGWLFNYHIIRVRIDQTKVAPQFIHWIIRASSDVDTYLEGNIRGATREGVNSKIVSNLPCRIPPLQEQASIIERLEKLQNKLSQTSILQTETQAELDALLPAVLDRAFRGEL